VGVFYRYNTSKGRTFMFGPGPRANATDAERACRNQGGHLASFASPAEQREVESYFIGQVGPTFAAAAAARGLRRQGKPRIVDPA
jgi:hypothetical protein